MVGCGKVFDVWFFCYVDKDNKNTIEDSIKVKGILEYMRCFNYFLGMWYEVNFLVFYIDVFLRMYFDI